MTCGLAEPHADAAGFVLAGGQSRRMGTEKSLLDFGGRPLIAHAVGILAAAGLPVSIAGAHAEARSRLEPYAPLIPDTEPGLGPLGGICTALASTTAAYGVFLPVDVPLLPGSLIRLSFPACADHGARGQRWPPSTGSRRHSRP